MVEPLGKSTREKLCIDAGDPLNALNIDYDNDETGLWVA